jgi:hypothetical protein
MPSNPPANITKKVQKYNKLGFAMPVLGEGSQQKS